MSLIHSASCAKEPSMLAFLRPAAKELEEPDRVGNTPLHYACSQGSYEVAKAIVGKICNSKNEGEGRFRISSITAESLEARRRTVKRERSPVKSANRRSSLKSFGFGRDQVNSSSVSSVF